jgi:hypothetical protein
MNGMDDLGRYHVALTLGGEPAMDGWWADRKIARCQFTAWIGERGSMPGVRITLVDEETGLLLEAWPDEE